MSRREAREIAVQALYQKEFFPDADSHVLEELLTTLSEEERAFYEQLITGVTHHIPEIDREIQKWLKTGWSMKRLSAVDRAILRLGVYELFYHPDTPYKVVVNEAVELAKKFGDEDSRKFINGVLGQIVRERSDRDEHEQDH